VAGGPRENGCSARRELPDIIVVFLKAVLAGFTIAAPIGSLGIICIRRTLAAGFLAGLISGFGVAVADGIYAAITALGLGAAAEYMGEIKRPLLLFSGLFVICLGWMAFKGKNQLEQKQKLNALSGIRSFSLTFFLTLSHPINIVAYTAVFGSLNLAADNDGVLAATIICGVFSGSFFWWIILCGSVARLSPETTTSKIRIINRLSALFLVAYGVWAIISAFA
jgi:putative LysE/RhtB family amino acid efflux pump